MVSSISHYLIVIIGPSMMMVIVAIFEWKKAKIVGWRKEYGCVGPKITGHEGKKKISASFLVLAAPAATFLLTSESRL